jgi:hypothetical protein
MNETLIELKTKLQSLSGQTRFASITYTAKESGETARHTILLNSDYLKQVEASKLEVELRLPTLTDATEIQAANELIASFQNTIDNAALGKSNDSYTKSGVYLPVGDGLKLNLNDGTLELSGISIQKTVLVEGVHKKVNSKPLTIAKNKIRRELPVGKFRTFALDKGAVELVKVNGETLEF